ncbi:ABC transporter substrate-binding protein [Kushneria phosphatilytica]|uniref:Probable sugar-binding periplasmic protein n=1 Tax=Kushneria phosphatilytica TaxID=657387 RepID=A0A1S1NSE7_9GAMM|nr:ABC transporter substrate-binding protein [Kushneria phosphatilytica]OHV08398.1 sugar ABC transporter substrate-binding protein [Kushneria phosphatilytica]QEL09822.1 carbohydrate ABC transporter substrate-binding protein [Kushneria phosphatilytica]
MIARRLIGGIGCTLLPLAMAMPSSSWAADQQSDKQVEVLNWWTSGSEAKALGVLKSDLAEQGIGWKNMPVAGGAGTNAMAVLRSRITSGNPPTAAQVLGFDARDWAQRGALSYLDEVAQSEKWGEVFPAAIKNFAQYEGHWIGAPFEIHSTNWVWANKSLMDKLGIEQPKTWDDFIASMKKAKDAGYLGLAYGGQPWQDATVFENVVLATGGADFYRKAFIDLDESALKSDTMVKAFDRMRELLKYKDDNSPGRDWNLATAMVINGKALYQIMGDWAKGEFLNGNLKPEQDFMCFRTPGTQDAVTFNSDLMIMFKTDDKQQIELQKTMARAIGSPEFQIAFSQVKGSVPARMDLSADKLDACAEKGYKQVKAAADNNTLMGSMAHGYAAQASVKNAVFDIVSSFVNSSMPSQTAAEQLAMAVQGAKS